MNKKFDFTTLDCEERLGIASSSMTGAGKFATFFPGLILTAIFYGILSLLKLVWSNQVFIVMFFPGGAGNRSFIPVLTVFFAMWCLSMLLMKHSKLKVQKKLLAALLPLPAMEEKMQFISENVCCPSDFAAANILEQAKLMESRNLDAAEKSVLIDSLINDYEKASDSSFIHISALIWAIPVLGFIGTVLGLAQAVGNFGEMAAGSNGFQALLPQVTGGLATAFETTLIALCLALILQLLSSSARHAEEIFFQQLKLLLSAGCSCSESSESENPGA